jgi:hypothetical protein
LLAWVLEPWSDTMTTRPGRTLAMALAIGLLLVGGAAMAAPTPATSGLDPAIDAYVAVHAGLFADDLAAAQLAASKLGSTAKDHADLARAAGAIAAAKDVAAARAAFGDASKALITLIAARPEGAHGVFAFKCPMAKGYQKWIQRVDTLQNPYMGQRMPSCGTHTSLEP